MAMEDERDRTTGTGSTDKKHHNLYRLNEIDDYEVADHDPDIRGWDVKSKDGNTIGEVKDLVVDKEAMKVRYIDVHLHEKVYNAEGSADMHLLVPIGAAALHKDNDNVLLDVIESPSELQQQYPVCPGPIITNGYERQLRQYYSERSHETNAAKLNATPEDKPILVFDKNDGDSFYNQEYFDENRLHRHRAKNT